LHCRKQTESAPSRGAAKQARPSVRHL
jgi:hypothetical protein